MKNFLREGAEWQAEMRTRHASDLLKVVRQGFVPLQIWGSPGRSTGEVLEGDSLYVVYRTRDWLFRASDWKLAPLPSPGQSTAAVATLPQQGDLIVMSDAAGNTYTYEVNPSDGEDAWRYADDYNIELRVHTKYVGTNLS